MAAMVNSYIIARWIEVLDLLNHPVIFKQFPILVTINTHIFATAVFFSTPWILSRRLKIAWPKNIYFLGLLTFFPNRLLLKIASASTSWPQVFGLVRLELWRGGMEGTGSWDKKEDTPSPQPGPWILLSTLVLTGRWFMCLFFTDRAVDNTVGPLRVHGCRKLPCAALHVEEEEEVKNDLLRDSAGHHRWATAGERGVGELHSC